MSNQTCTKKGDLYTSEDGSKFEPQVKSLLAKAFNLGTTNFLRQLEKNILIQNIEAYPDTFVKCQISYETRDIKDVISPGAGSVTSDRKRHAYEFNIWDMGMPVQDIFKESKNTVTLPYTDYVESCPVCAHHGNVTCRTCDGIKHVPCPKCLGTGYNVSSDAATGNTAGNASENANGSVKTLNDTSLAGASAESPAFCRTCGGTGSILCPDCGGTGAVTCDTCGGTGAVTNSVIVTSEIHTADNSNMFFMSKLRSELVPFFDELNDSFSTHTVAVYESSTPILSINTKDFNYRLTETEFNTGAIFNNLCDTINTIPNMRILKYRAIVFQRIYLKITYVFDDRVYTMYYDSGSKKSILTSNPYDDIITSLAEGVRIAYENKDYKMLSIRLSEYRALKKSSKREVNVKKDPETIAESMCDRFTLSFVFGLIIPLVLLTLLVTTNPAFTSADAKSAIIASIISSVIFVVSAYAIIKRTWTNILTRVSFMSARLTYTVIAFIASALVFMGFTYLVYLV